MTAPPPDGVDCSPQLMTDAELQDCEAIARECEITPLSGGKYNPAAPVLRKAAVTIRSLRARVTELEAQTQEALRLYGAVLNEKSSIVQLLDQRTALLQELRSWNTSEWVKPSFRELLARVDASLPKAAARSAP